MAIAEYSDSHSHPRPALDRLTASAVRRNLDHAATIKRTLARPSTRSVASPTMLVRMRAQLKGLEAQVASLRAGRKRHGFRPV
jgi:hypothetical protein